MPFFDQEKQPGQLCEVVQQDGPGHAAEQVVPSDQRVQLEQKPQQQQHAVPEPSAQPSSWSHEEPLQVSTTPRRARTPDDETEMRIDWEKLALDNSSVCDIYTGLKLNEEQVRAGRETEVKRM